VLGRVQRGHPLTSCIRRYSNPVATDKKSRCEEWGTTWKGDGSLGCQQQRINTLVRVTTQKMKEVVSMYERVTVPVVKDPLSNVPLIVAMLVDKDE
jgi:hypothetical protein